MKTVMGLASKRNLQADPPGMAVGFGSDSAGEDGAFLPSAASRGFKGSAVQCKHSQRVW